MTYYNPIYNIVSMTVDCPVGGFPTITWAADHGDYVQLFRATVGDFSQAEVIAGLSGNTGEWTDDTILIDGTGYWYWAIAFGPGALEAGSNNAVSFSRCFAEISFSFDTPCTLPPPPIGPAGGAVAPLRIIMPVNVDGVIRAQQVINVPNFTPGFPVPQNPPPKYAVNMELDYDLFHSQFNFPIAGSTVCGVQFFEIPGSYDSGVFDTHPLFSTDTYMGVNSFFELNQDTDDPIIGDTNNFGRCSIPGDAWSIQTAVTAHADLIYMSPAVAFAVGGSGVPGPNWGTPLVNPGLNPGPLNNGIPVPTPLPCIPCCSTAAPLCECRKPNQK